MSDAIIRDRRLTGPDIAALTADGAAYHLIECNLDETRLAERDLSGWTFERVTLQSSDFRGTKLERTIWRSCRGGLANFTGSDMTEASALSSDFNNSVFRGARLGSAGFQGCKLTGADLSDAKAMDLRFEETLLINAKLPSLSFRKMALKRIDFSYADLRNCDFRASVLEGCSLREANMTGARFAEADLRGADLGGLRLSEAALFRGATISREQAGQLLGELGLNVR
jgi:uncharacterized protein YjbI with pentapeptide repeats